MSTIKTMAQVLAGKPEDIQVWVRQVGSTHAGLSIKARILELPEFDITEQGATLEQFCQAFAITVSAMKLSASNGLANQARGLFRFYESEWASILQRSWAIDPNIPINLTWAEAVADEKLCVDVGVAWAKWLYDNRNATGHSRNQAITGRATWSDVKDRSEWFKVASLMLVNESPNNMTRLAKWTMKALDAVVWNDSLEN